jgi:hypothetical protein
MEMDADPGITALGLDHLAAFIGAGIVDDENLADLVTDLADDAQHLAGHAVAWDDHGDYRRTLSLGLIAHGCTLH